MPTWGNERRRPTWGNKKREPKWGDKKTVLAGSSRMSMLTWSCTELCPLGATREVYMPTWGCERSTCSPLGATREVYTLTWSYERSIYAHLGL